MLMATNPLEQEETAQDEEVGIQEPAKVILFNDEVHTFDEVIGQLVKATRCTSDRAEGGIDQHIEALVWDQVVFQKNRKSATT